MPLTPFQYRLRGAIERIPERQHIRRVSLFGSHAKGTARPDSDIDLLVEFSSPVGLFTLVRMQRELERTLHAPVDLVTPPVLSPYIRPHVLRDAIPVYES